MASPDARACPDLDLLRELESGRLPDHQADRTLPHVTACGTCNRTLDRLRSEDLDGRVLRAALRDHAAAIVALALINKFL